MVIRSLAFLLQDSFGALCVPKFFVSLDTPCILTPACFDEPPDAPLRQEREEFGVQPADMFEYNPIA